MRLLKHFLFALALSAPIAGVSSGPSLANGANVANVHMVVWRGCEEACKAFVRYFEDRELPVDVKVTDVGRNRDLLPEIQEQLKAERPDLVVTWGTSVSRGLLGTLSDYGTASALGDIPAIFMIVADPVGSDIVQSYEETGRPMISGVRNRAPEDVQLRLLFEFKHPHKLGVLNHPDELNSSLNTDKLRLIADDLQFELIEELYQPEEDGSVDVDQIPLAMARLKAHGAEAIYVGSSSYNLEHQDAFVAAATELGLPVFSAYTKMVREGGALMAVGTSYANVGRLAGVQAEKIVLGGEAPGELPVTSLSRYSVIVNMMQAQRLNIYPPLSLLSVAEVVR
ncbi:ABC transporter substrate-binding protein [Epibacterium ulvae]|uniref:ABC transporter substrate-binding protein n=1 Tax=Epibacterium ulvae TaxID=1156985 RepID=UPI0024919FF1|nr:ABC transporter substrate-binding protein [Epibacterium ulvae]